MPEEQVDGQTCADQQDLTIDAERLAVARVALFKPHPKP
jgi:hypothetical protein